MLWAVDDLNGCFRSDLMYTPSAVAVGYSSYRVECTHSVCLMNASFTAWYKCHTITLFVFIIVCAKD